MKYPPVLEVDPEMSMRVKTVYLVRDLRKFQKGSGEVKQRRKPIQSVLMWLPLPLLAAGVNLMGTLGDGVDPVPLNFNFWSSEVGEVSDLAGSLSGPSQSQHFAPWFCPEVLLQEGGPG